MSNIREIYIGIEMAAGRGKVHGTTMMGLGGTICNVHTTYIKELNGLTVIKSGRLNVDLSCNLYKFVKWLKTMTPKTEWIKRGAA